MEEDSVGMKKRGLGEEVKGMIQGNLERRREGWIAGKRQRKPQW